MRSAISATRNAAQMLAADSDKPGADELRDVLTAAAEIGQRIADGQAGHRDRVALRYALASLSIAQQAQCRSKPHKPAAGVLSSLHRLPAAC
jgi:hypothetical protein